MAEMKGPARRSKRSKKKHAQDQRVLSGQPAGDAKIAQPSRRVVAGVCLALCLAIAALYGQTSHYGFISYDDDQYVYENPRVQDGLTVSGIRWACTTFHYANWHPLTWMSLMLDYELFGKDPGAFHLENMVWHMAGSVLLFLALVRMTRCMWRSAMVAAIFALHPLHVESVAWISERKDVLSTALAMLALLIYVAYTERPTVRTYVWVGVVYALSLAAKPMLVTLPFVFMLLDVWPLGRVKPPFSWSTLKPPLLEKTPLLGMAAISSVLTFFAQHSYGAVQTIKNLSVQARIGNACIAYVTYLWKAFVPTDLAVFYPAVTPEPATALIAVAALGAVTVWVLRSIRTRPYLAIGWLWYLGTLVPVIGLVQVGAQSSADRYTYLPLIGCSLALVWGIADLLERRPVLQRVGAGAGGFALLLLAVDAHAQVAYWRDSRTLFEHTLEVTKGNYMILNNLAVTLAAEGQHAEAIADYRKAITINPDYAVGRANLGHELVGMGKLDEARASLVEAIRLKPDIGAAHADLGAIAGAHSEFGEAERQLGEAIRLEPANADAQNNLCWVLLQERREDALSHCDEALRLKPDLLEAHLNRGRALAALGKNAEAEAEFQRVLAADPNRDDARTELEHLRAPGGASQP